MSKIPLQYQMVDLAEISATDPLLKTAFHQRLIRGLFRKGSRFEAEAELKNVDFKAVQTNIHEQGYYKILLTYRCGKDSSEITS